MAKSVGEFIVDLAKKAGIPETDKSIVDFVQDKELFTKILPDGIETGIDNQLISLKDAKNNHPDIKGFYHKQALDGLDAVIKQIIDDEKDDALKTEILAEQNTYKRVPLLTKKIKELENKKANSKQSDKKELQDEIDKLNGLLRTEKENVAKALQDKDKEVVGFKKNYLIKSMLQAYKTTLDELDGEVRSTTLSTLLNKELQDNKAQLTFDEHDNLILLKQDGSNYYGDDNKQVDAKSFIEKTLSRNKLLKVNDQTQIGNGDTTNGRQHQANPQGGSGGGEQPKKNHTLSGLAQEALKNLTTNANVSVMGT